ncbi:hypothetical protein DERP_001904, partial [Dermatophagoides pteronyssinus]
MTIQMLGNMAGGSGGSYGGGGNSYGGDPMLVLSGKDGTMIAGGPCSMIPFMMSPSKKSKKKGQDMIMMIGSGCKRQQSYPYPQPKHIQ